ncbi:MAG: acriflavine resistance protein B [Planctomycetes bacterium]|nr:acriflavine resistance protein B [Planctomycetota bacterium]
MIQRLVARFLEGPNAALLLLAALALGTAAVLLTPREEEPQIVVPMADVMVSAPGHSAEEVARLVATPLERLLWQIDGVEHVYSSSQRDQALVTVRFYVGEDREDSLVKLHDQLEQNLDRVPSIVQSWLVKPVSIDDVPIVTLALHGADWSADALRRVAEEMQSRLDGLRGISRTELIGGQPRRIRVELDRERMHARGLTLAEVGAAIRESAATASAGGFDRLDQHLTLDVGEGFQSISDLEGLVLAGEGSSLVFLRDVATVSDAPAEADHYTRIGFGPGSAAAGLSRESVTLAVAKQRGTDATRVAESVLAEAERLRAEVLPAGVDMTVTRNDGATADEKVDALLSSIGFALATVVALLLFTLGWREALVVAIAVPVSFALALTVNGLLGYTINRVTLFALILSLGLVVDDPITNVDNIQRHLRKSKGAARDAVLSGVREVLPPVIMSTLTIVVSFLPMFFITGMMGPYMAPMASNVPLTVGFSTLAAVTIVPWLAYKLLRNRRGGEGKEDTVPKWLRRGYRGTLAPILRSRGRAWMLLLAVGLLFAGAWALPLLGKVPLKMLPFDNKNRLQLVVDLPEGSTLERTNAVVQELEAFLGEVPEVVSFTSYVGTASPMDFNSMVRHGYLRQTSELADLRVQLLHHSERALQSHAIAMRIRDALTEIGARHDAVVKLVETPPGPPVLATMVAEIYGDEATSYQELTAAAAQLAGHFRAEAGVREVDVMVSVPHDRVQFVLDRQQAAVHGVREAQLTRLLTTAVRGETVGDLRAEGERQPLPIELRLSRAQRSGGEELGRLAVRALDGQILPLQELGSFERRPADPVIHHKNLQPVVYLTAEMVGRAPGEAVLALQSKVKDDPLPPNIEVEWAGEGEWEITLRVFRDMGLAYIAALLGIYLLLTIETKSLAMPLLVMMAIPLTAIGMMPGFWGLNALFAGRVGDYADSTFFTATAMIGMIALGGIVVRNSLVLLQFIQNELAAGKTLIDSVCEAGAVRMRPIVLTAATTALGAWPITLDPIFSGLAWALIFGLVASTAFTLLVVPTVFWMLHEKAHRKK